MPPPVEPGAGQARPGAPLPGAVGLRLGGVPAADRRGREWRAGERRSHPRAMALRAAWSRQVRGRLGDLSPAHPLVHHRVRRRRRRRGGSQLRQPDHAGRLTVCRLRSRHDELKESFLGRAGRVHQVGAVLREADALDRSDFADVCLTTSGLPVVEVTRLVRGHAGGWPVLTGLVHSLSSETEPPQPRQSPGQGPQPDDLHRERRSMPCRRRPGRPPRHPPDLRRPAARDHHDAVPAYAGCDQLMQRIMLRGQGGGPGTRRRPGTRRDRRAAHRHRRTNDRGSSPRGPRPSRDTTKR